MNKDIDWAIKQKAPHSCKHVLFILANRADKSHQCFPSLTSITQDTGLDRRTVMRCLTTLEELNLVTRHKRGIETTVYTLMVGSQRPYSQGHHDPRGTMTLGAPVREGRGIDDTQVGALCPTEPLREPKVNPKQGDLRKRTGAPSVFPISEPMRKWATENHVSVNLETETETMLDYHRGKGNLQADWLATWRTWMRNSIKFANRNGGNGNGQYKDKQQLNIEAAQRLLARLHPEDSGGDERNVTRAVSGGLFGGIDESHD